MALAFRNLAITPDAPVSEWPAEAVQTALERGDLTDWHRIVAELQADPWGRTARQVAEVLSHSRPYGVAEAMGMILSRTRERAETSERAAVAAEIREAVSRSGLSRAEFASCIGTSASRLSTYASGKVTPSATLLLRIRRVADGFRPAWSGGSMSTVAHKPDRRLDDPKELLLGFLDYYRSVITRKIDGLTDAELRTSRLPSGWTPLELLKHLVYMERRWLSWGFLAEQVDDPRGDDDESGRWHCGPGDTAAGLIARLRATGERTRAIASAAGLSDVSAAGGRFSDDDPRPRPTLAWILAYVLQEYARHAGHLDVARELADGSTGE